MSNNIRTIFAQLAEQVDQWREELGIPGAAIGISLSSERYTHGSGVTNSDHPLDVTGETLFQIGSITKTVTATTMMRLVNERLLDLDAPVREYLPDFRVANEDVSRRVTIKHLLTHSAGWVGDIFTDTGDNDDALAEYVKQLATVEQLAPLDTVLSYNNAAFCVAGRVIEVVSGERYEDAVMRLVFVPLGLDHSFFFPKDLMTHRFAVGHRVADDAAIVQRPWAIPRASNAAGGIACDTHDLLRYGEFYLGDGTVGDKRLLPSEAMTTMQSPHFPINDYHGSMGLAWFVREIGGVRTIEHGGGTLGQVSQLVVVPERDFVFVMLTNAGSGSQLIEKAEKWIFQTLFNLEKPTPQPIEADESLLSTYAGKYSRPISDIELRVEDGKLIAQIMMKGGLNSEDTPPPPPPFEMMLCGKDQLVVTEGPFKSLTGEIIRHDTGEIAYLRLGMRINRRIIS